MCGSSCRKVGCHAFCLPLVGASPCVAAIVSSSSCSKPSCIFYICQNHGSTQLILCRRLELVDARMAIACSKGGRFSCCCPLLPQASVTGNVTVSFYDAEAGWGALGPAMLSARSNPQVQCTAGGMLLQPVCPLPASADAFSKHTTTWGITHIGCQQRAPTAGHSRWTSC